MQDRGRGTLCGSWSSPRLRRGRAARCDRRSRPPAHRRPRPDCFADGPSRIPRRGRPGLRPPPRPTAGGSGPKCGPQWRVLRSSTTDSRRTHMSNKMWGGRFGSGPDPLLEEINASIDFDRHLYRQDIAASKCHAAMLAKTGIITAQDAKRIAHGLDTILSEIDAGRFKFKRALEDIHMNVESRLGELIGPAAGRLHTARSRNDQVATDFRLWVRDAIDDIDVSLAAYQRALAEKALDHADTV